MPLPYPLVYQPWRHPGSGTRGAGPGGRQRSRLVWLRAVQLGVNLVVSALNHTAEQYAYRPTMKALRRQPNPAQRQMAARLELFVREWCCSSSPGGLRCGRKGDTLVEQLRLLEEHAVEVHGDVDPYREISLGKTSSSASSPYGALDPDRLNFVGMGPKFDVADLLGPLFALPFLEPRLIARPRVDTGAYAWTAPCAREQPRLMQLFRQWAEADRFELVRGGRPAHLSSRVFNVYKDENRDRQIIDARGPNGAEQLVAPGPSRDLASGWQMGDLIVEPNDEELRGSAKDRKDFYHGFEVSPERIERNACGIPMPLSAFADFPADPVTRLLQKEDETDETRRRPREERGDELGVSLPRGEAPAQNVYGAFATE